MFHFKKKNSTTKTMQLLQYTIVKTVDLQQNAPFRICDGTMLHAYIGHGARKTKHNRTRVRITSNDQSRLLVKTLLLVRVVSLYSSISKNFISCPQCMYSLLSRKNQKSSQKRKELDNTKRLSRFIVLNGVESPLKLIFFRTEEICTGQMIP